MRAWRPWIAVFSLITFVVGGAVMPVLHRVDHVAKWYAEQAAAHDHEEPTHDSIGEACDDVAEHLQHCSLCHRDFFSDLVPALSLAAKPQADILFSAVPQRAAPPLDAHYLIRAPPAAA